MVKMVKNINQIKVWCNYIIMKRDEGQNIQYHKDELEVHSYEMKWNILHNTLA